jgi:hypothetical protein
VFESLNWALSAEPAIWERALRPYRAQLTEVGGGSLLLMHPAVTAERLDQARLARRDERPTLSWLGRDIEIAPGAV